MARNVIYVNNTYPQPLAPDCWQSRCICNLRRYSELVGADLKVVGLDNPHVQTLEGYREAHAGRLLGQPGRSFANYWYFAVLRKHARIIEFINSDYERALFCDLDCLAVPHHNIFDSFDDHEMYILTERYHLQSPELFPDHPLFRFKLVSVEELIPESSQTSDYYDLNSSLFSLNKNHAVELHRFLCELSLNPFDEDDYINMLQLSVQYMSRADVGDKVIIIIDENLIQLAVNAGVIGPPVHFPRFVWVKDSYSFKQLVEDMPVFLLPRKRVFPIEEFAELDVLLWS